MLDVFGLTFDAMIRLLTFLCNSMNCLKVAINVFLYLLLIYATSVSSNKDLTCTGNTCSRGNLKVLDKLLHGYDNKEWPTYNEDKPTVVSVNIYVTSLSSISASSMDYTMDVFLRQKWKDPRLNTKQYSVNHTLTMNKREILDKIWKPDLYFHNVKSASFHEVTVPNILIRMANDGTILYSMRLKLTLSCHMSLVNYPLDTQKCMIILGSYAHSVDMILLNWMGEPVQRDANLEIPEFNLVLVKPSTYCLSKYITGYFSCLNATFVLRRQNGFHLIQTYLPTFLIVTISWVSFWLDVNAIPARVTLGVTTLLTLTTLASGARATLPPVSYIKAIDVWIGVCSLFVFSALLEFTLVNYLSRKTYDPNRRVSIWRRPPKMTQEGQQMETMGVSKQSRSGHQQAASSEGPNLQEMKDKVTNLRRARKVDKICRILFPFVFFVFNLIYWPYYLTQTFDFD